MKFHIFALQGFTRVDLLQLGVIVGPDGELSADPEHERVNETILEAHVH